MIVFILEENIAFIEQLKLHLKNLKQYEIYTFSTLPELLLSARLDPHVVLLDYADEVQSEISFSKVSEKMPCAKFIQIFQNDNGAFFLKNGKKEFDFTQALTTHNVLDHITKDLNKIGKIDPLNDFLENVNSISIRDRIPSIFILEETSLFSTFLRFRMARFEKLSIISFDDPEQLFAEKTNPDILIVDFNLKKTWGSMLQKMFETHFPKAKIIMLSSPTDLSNSTDHDLTKYLVKGDNWQENLLYFIEEELMLN